MAQSQLPSSFELGLEARAAELVFRYCCPDKPVAAAAGGRGGSKKKPRMVTATTTTTTTTSDDGVLLDSIKQLCKTAPAEAGPALALAVVRDHLSSQKTTTTSSSSSKRTWLALRLTHELFMRSASFRAALCGESASIARVVDAALTSKADDTWDWLVEWDDKFGARYPQLRLAVRANAKLMEHARRAEQERAMVRAVEAHQVQEIECGFRMFDSGSSDGGRLGQKVAQVLVQATTQLQELDACLSLFLTFPSIAGEEDDEEELEWEEDEEAASSALPQDYALRVQLPSTADQQDRLRDVQTTMRDGRVTILRTLLPQVREWSATLEQRVTTDDTVVAALLLRVKALLRDLGEAAAQVERCCCG